MPEPEFVVTPWEVRGEVDYDKLIRRFGTRKITKKLHRKVEGYTGEIHMFLRRGIFFSHRDLDWILDMYDEGEKFFLYTGRGPSGHTHLGHLIPWIFTRYLQDVFDVELYFQITDDEKFLYHPEFSLSDTNSFAYENILDIIALGFNPEKTFIFNDTEYGKTIYRLALEVSKHITFSIVKAVFGFKHSSNIGLVFFPAIQAVPCFLPSYLKGKNIPCLIPASIDQDPYWRGISRYVAPKLGYYKPAQIHSKFLPGLGKGGKMSSSEPETCIFTTDLPKLVVKKIMNAYTGGRPTVDEQRKLGGEPNICPVYQYYFFLFEEDDEKLEEIYKTCRSGERLCGFCKKILSGRVKEFIAEHQRKREEARNSIERFMLRD
ncbi:MAG: tryptophan--tRNA ligase [Nitrososphaeria archaeon]|nr:tryptophan--tRNA ligase [Nitrososphaeria archaeon]NIN52661.1 tryptophan--tRNA ligase [Nitrososphaeria archaeon]NIQ33136.1 tryptophan--tRNA ligase [Nitrososphaeria archaeon]